MRPEKPKCASDAAGVALNDDMTFSGTVAGVSCKFLLDTGSSINVINKSLLDVLPRVTLLKTATKAKTASQEELPLIGLVKVPVKIADQSHVVTFYVTESIDVPCLLGLDFLHVVPCVIDLSGRRLLLTEQNQVRSISAEKTSVGRAVVGSDFSLPPAAECFVKGYTHNCDYTGPVLVEPCLSLPGGAFHVKSNKNRLLCTLPSAISL